jgi:hypothetical protein
MEQETQKRLDAVLEDELRRGYRTKEVPASLQDAQEDGATIRLVRFTRMNPARRRKIAEVVQRQYHRDLQNPDILSHEQLLKLVAERGEWTTDMSAELERLQASTNKAMGELFADGIAQDNWSLDLMAAAAAFRTKVEEHVTKQKTRDALLVRFNRWLEFTSDEQADYDTEHAASQSRERYSPDYDMQRLLEAVPDVEAAEHLHLIDDLRERLHRYLKLQRERLRLSELQLRHAKIFAESVEQRRDNAEEMARLYFTAERLGEDSLPAGPLTPTFQDLYDLPEGLVQWLLVEAYFFQNGIPDEAREYLQTFGFLTADEAKTADPSETGASGHSDESPAPQISKPDTDPPVATAPDSSASSAPMTLMTDS